MNLVSCLTIASSLAWLGASPAAPVGWRTDGSGNYRGGGAATEWSVERNVVWKTALPGRSQSSPIVVGDRVFTASDPAELICVKATDGSILWRRTLGLAEVYGPEKATEVAAEFKRLRTERQTFERALNAAKDDADQQQIVKPQLEAANQALRQQSEQFASPPELANGEVTNSAPTPVSDGTRVFALFGNGIVGAYTLDGEPLWAKFIEGPTIGFGSCSSPLLCDGKVIVHLNDLFALDAATGETVWRAKLAARHASPISVSIEGMPAMVNPAGAVVRCADGKVLLQDNQLSNSECSAILHDGLVYRTSEGKAAAYRLVRDGDDAVKLERLWEEKISSGRRTPSPLLHGGLLYAVNTDGILDVLDAATGESVYRNRLNVGSVYASITAVGDHLYFSGTKGTTVVLAAGREYREVARNELESLGGSIVFHDGRLFVRTHKHLYCIGP